MPSFRSTVPRLISKTKVVVLLCLFVIGVAGNLHKAQGQTPAAGDIVFSQVYTSGGNPGAAYHDNFIELFNRSNNPIDISGWPLHIGGPTGPFNVGISFTSSRGLTIQPGGHLLIVFETTGTSGAALPFFDLFVPQIPQFPINLPASGKLAITLPNTTLMSQCPVTQSGVVDAIGYGSATTCFEGSGPTATIGDLTAAIRKKSGCTETNNNSADFLVSAPNPRNSFWPKHLCSANAIDESDFFVRQHYSDFLNREPDPNGLSFWSNQIAVCGTNQACIEIKRINVSAAFFLSIEFQQTGYLVYRTYKAAYGNLPNAPVPLRLAEFLPDTQQISQGVVVNAPGWEQLLANNKTAFFMDFVSRARFVNDYLTTMTPAQFVDTLFSKAGVTPSAAERAAAMDEFGSATDTNNTAARARVLRRVAENPALEQQEKNEAFVLMQYFGYLRRNPNDPPEATLDFGGYDFWLNKLNQFNGNFVNADMVKSFIISGEYRQRF